MKISGNYTFSNFSYNKQIQQKMLKDKYSEKYPVYDQISFGNTAFKVSKNNYFILHKQDGTREILTKFNSDDGEGHKLIIAEKEIDTLLTDKNGDISPDYVNYFISFYKHIFNQQYSEYKNNKETNRAIIKGEHKFSLPNPLAYVKGNIMPLINMREIKQKEDELNFNRVEIAKDLMLQDKEFRKKVDADSYQNTVFMMSLCRTNDGMDLSDVDTKLNQTSNNVFLKLDELYNMPFSQTMIDASKDEEGKANMRLINFMHNFLYKTHDCPPDKIKSVMDFARPILQSMKYNDIYLMLDMAEFTNLYDLSEPQYFDYLKYCVNEKTNYHDHDVYLALYDLCDASINWQLDNFEVYDEDEFLQIQKNMIDEYFSLYKDENGGLKPECIGPKKFATEFLKAPCIKN